MTKAEEPKAWRDVLAERRRQVDVEGWSPKHDDTHKDGSIALAAACYAAPVEVRAQFEIPCQCRSVECSHNVFPNTEWRRAWPWAETWWKPRSARENLVRAGALILAEIERLDRAQEPPR